MIIVNIEIVSMKVKNEMCLDNIIYIYLERGRSSAPYVDYTVGLRLIGEDAE